MAASFQSCSVSSRHRSLFTTSSFHQTFAQRAISARHVVAKIDYSTHDPLLLPFDSDNHLPNSLTAGNIPQTALAVKYIKTDVLINSKKDYGHFAMPVILVVSKASRLTGGQLVIQSGKQII